VCRLTVSKLPHVIYTLLIGGLVLLQYGCFFMQVDSGNYVIGTFEKAKHFYRFKYFEFCRSRLTSLTRK
jgi:hypothetical protein